MQFITLHNEPLHRCNEVEMETSRVYSTRLRKAPYTFLQIRSTNINDPEGASTLALSCQYPLYDRFLEKCSLAIWNCFEAILDFLAKALCKPYSLDCAHHVAIGAFAGAVLIIVLVGAFSSTLSKQRRVPI